MRNAIFGVAGVTLLSKFLGFLREMVIAHKFGTSALYDSYLIAVMLPALGAGIFSFASVYLLVPYLSRKIQAEGRSDSILSAWPVLNSYFIISLAATAGIYFGAPYIMKIWAGDYSPVDFAQVVFFARVTSVLVLLSTIEAFCRAFLNVRGIFTYPAAGYIVFNLFSISAVLLWAESLSVGAVALGVVGGQVLQNIYLTLRLFGLNPGKDFSFKVFGPETKALLSTASIIILIEAINRSYFLIDRYYASAFGAGIISALNYSQVLVQLPDAVIGFAIGTVLFPMFSRASLTGDMTVFGRVYGKAIIAAVLIAVPIAGFVYVGAEEIIALVFQRGQFDAQSVEITAAVLRPYAPTIVALFIISTSIRASYSGGWAKRVLAFVLLSLAIKFAGTALLPNWISYPGISAATSAAFLMMAILLTILVARKTMTGENHGFALSVTRILIAGPIATVAIMTAKAYWMDYRPVTILEHVGFLAGIFVVVVLSFILVLTLLGGYRSTADLVSNLRRVRPRMEN